MLGRCFVSGSSLSVLVKEAGERGLGVIAETCPRYLFPADQVLSVHRGFAKCNPALRTAEEVEVLWSYLHDGTLGFVGSDHSP